MQEHNTVRKKLKNWCPQNTVLYKTIRYSTWSRLHSIVQYSTWCRLLSSDMITFFCAILYMTSVTFILHGVVYVQSCTWCRLHSFYMCKVLHDVAYIHSTWCRIRTKLYSLVFHPCRFTALFFILVIYIHSTWCRLHSLYTFILHGVELFWRNNVV